MGAKSLSFFAILLCTATASAAEPCELAAFDQDKLRAAGYTIQPLTDQEKARVVDFEKRTQGEVPASLESLAQGPGFAVYQTGARWTGVRYQMPNKGALMFTDPEQRCVLFSHSVGGETAVHVIRGTWQLRAY